MPLFPLRDRPVIRWLIDHPIISLGSLAAIGAVVAFIIWYAS